MQTTELSALSVLAVDDSLTTLRLVTDVLRAAGLTQVHTITSAEQALNRLEGLRPDIICVDWQMPGMDGLAMTKVIRAAALKPDPMIPNPAVPIIMLTGRRREVDVEAARLAGVTEFIAKPFSASTLLTRIAAVGTRARAFVVAEEFVGPDRRRRAGDGYSGPKRRAADPRADALDYEEVRQVMRLELEALRGRAAPGAAPDRKAVAQCYRSMRSNIEKARVIRDAAVEQAAKSLVRYVDAVGGPQAADGEVIRVHMDALARLLALGAPAQDKVLNRGLAAAVDKKIGSTEPRS